MAKSKYYVVWKGLKPGIYDNWNEAKAQIFGFQGAQYKSYLSMEEAKKAYLVAPTYQPSKQKAPSNSKQLSYGLPNRIEQNSIAVDAACSGNPGDMEYRGVITSTAEQLFLKGPYKNGTNNIGEFLAIVHGLAYLQKLEKHDVIVYTDSETAIGWVKKKKANTKLALTKDNQILFDTIARAELWLKSNTYTNKILKWETKKWGEIPADFGRK
jgi:ribonuclease HI